MLLYKLRTDLSVGTDLWNFLPSISLIFSFNLKLHCRLVHALSVMFCRLLFQSIILGFYKWPVYYSHVQNMQKILSCNKDILNIYIQITGESGWQRRSYGSHWNTWRALGAKLQCHVGIHKWWRKNSGIHSFWRMGKNWVRCYISSVNSMCFVIYMTYSKECPYSLSDSFSNRATHTVLNFLFLIIGCKLCTCFN
jgi:hypothetical protein